MADKRTTPEAPEGAPQAAPEGPRRKKRAGPTIDLSATEVPPAHSATPPQSELQPAAEEPAPANAAQAETPPTQTGGAFGVAALAGGAAGVVAALVVLLGLYVAGLLPLQPTFTTTTTQVAADNKAVDALTQRISKVEESIKKLPTSNAGVAERLAAADSAIKSLGVALTALSHRSDDIAANAGQARERADAAAKAVADLQASIKANPPAGAVRADIEALDKRIAALESATQSAQADIGKITSKNSGNDTAARLALLAAMLRDAVTSGASFANELAQLKSLGGDDKTLAPLAPFATSGVPTAPTLSQELYALLPTMLKISGVVAPEDGFLERLEANAGKLVRIRPVTAPTSDEPSAVLARIEIDASKADIAAALSDLGKLDSATRAPAQAWIAKAQARQAALDAARQYAANTARALGSKAGTQ
jgi:hypothetical protein